ncbi:PIG-L family deacetylase [Pelagibacterales bacterium SAG-MED46]|nr:PIG-L family deacetylase [Pelagibacterales bacterium SAG-MED46]
MENVLVICAHPDDEVLGCGGTLLKHKSKKDKINILYVFEGSSGRNKIEKSLTDLNLQKRKKSALAVAKYLKVRSINFLNNENLNSNSLTKLKITNEITQHVDKIKPTIIYTHSSKDLNIDHRNCLEAVLIATRTSNSNKLKKILSFEIPSSTEWSFNLFGSFSGNYFVNIEKFIKVKLKLINMYKYELKKFPYPRSKENILSQSKFVGSFVGFKNAERFEVVKILD